MKEEVWAMGYSARYSRKLIGMPLLFIVSFISAQTDPETQALQLMPREQFKMSIPKISVTVDDETKEFDGVRISFPGSKDHIFIGTYDDMNIKYTSHGSEKTLHREIPEKASFLTKFEIKTIMNVNSGFAAELDRFEANLQKGKLAQCCYFDAFFPHFLGGYYHLLYAAKNSPTALPRAARVPESAFDVSLNSPKTDARIAQWSSSPEYIIKLRIAAKELVYQLREWQKALDRVKENIDVVSSKEFEDAFIIFVRVYFNLKPPSPVILKKLH